MEIVQVRKLFFAFAYMKADEKDAASIVEKTENCPIEQHEENIENCSCNYGR